LKQWTNPTVGQLVARSAPEAVKQKQSRWQEELRYWVLSEHAGRVPKAIKAQGDVAVFKYLQQRARSDRMCVSEAESEEGILTLRRRTH
jgi:hypothetical protein